MSYSNRPTHRPDPTVSPYDLDATGRRRLRAPFTPSYHQERLNNIQAQARKRNRKGLAFHGRAFVMETDRGPVLL